MVVRPLVFTSIIVALFVILRNPASAAEIRTFQQGVDGYTGASDQSFTFPGVAGSATSSTIRLDFPDAGQPDGSYGYLKFDDLFGTGSNQIPTSGIILQSATLSGFVTNRFGSANIHQLLQDISAKPVSPNTLVSPGVAGTFYTPIGSTGIDNSATNTPVPFTPISWDVTSVLQAWIDGQTNFGMLLIPNTTDGGDIVSADGAILAQRPLLMVEFALIPPAPEPSSLLLLACGSLLVVGRRRARRSTRQS